jgi:hypothetical protein
MCGLAATTEIDFAGTARTLQRVMPPSDETCARPVDEARNLAATSRECKHDFQPIVRAGPELRDHVSSGTPHDVPQRRGDDEGIVELTEHRDEIRDEIDRASEIRNDERECDLGSPRNAWVSQEALEKDEAVANKCRRQAATARRASSNSAI